MRIWFEEKFCFIKKRSRVFISEEEIFEAFILFLHTEVLNTKTYKQTKNLVSAAKRTKNKEHKMKGWVIEKSLKN